MILFANKIFLAVILLAATVVQAVLPVIVEFSKPGGMYRETQHISLTASSGVVRYTLDGSAPTASSPVATGPIAIAQSKALTAQVFGGDTASAAPKTQTYIIGFENHGVPVFALSASPAGIDSINSNHNSMGNDETGELPAYIEAYDSVGTQFISQNGGIKSHGRGSNLYRQKSFAVYARKIYGPKNFPAERLFPSKRLDKADRFLLRNGGNDNPKALIRDLVIQRMAAKTMSIDYQDGRPVVLFVNGGFYGIQILAEKADEHFPDNNYGIDDSLVDFIEGAIGGKAIEVTSGSLADLSALNDYINGCTAMTDGQYDSIAKRIDLDNFIDYLVAEFFNANLDWASNVKQWRDIRNGKKWRWILFDMDYGAIDPFVMFFEHQHGKTFYPTWIANLLKNPTFRARYLQRFAAHLALTFDPDEAAQLIAGTADLVSPLIPLHADRWSDGIESLAAWSGEVAALKSFYASRPAIMKTQLASQYASITPASPVTIRNETPLGGILLIEGVPMTKPQITAEFYRTFPLHLTAQAAPGYRFARWGTGETTDQRTILPESVSSISAFFEKSQSGIHPDRAISAFEPPRFRYAKGILTIQSVPPFRNNAGATYTIADIRGGTIARGRIDAWLSTLHLAFAPSASGAYFIRFAQGAPLFTSRFAVTRFP